MPKAFVNMNFSYVIKFVNNLFQFYMVDLVYELLLTENNQE